MTDANKQKRPYNRKPVAPEQPAAVVTTEPVSELPTPEKKFLSRSSQEKIARIKKMREKGDLRIYETKLPRNIELDGFVTAWFNDRNDRLSSQMNLGWEFVKKGEVHLDHGVTSDDSPDSRIRRYAGLDELNKPYYAYLMKVETEVHAELMQYRNEEAERNLKSIHQKPDGTYTPDSQPITLTRK